MDFNSFASYFQLAAAFSLTFCSFEQFMEGITHKLIQSENDKMSALKENDIDRHLNKINLLQLELSTIADRHRIFFFHVFLSCVMFLIIAGFEKFYTSLHFQEKFFGIIIIPFISILVFLIFKGKVVREDQIDTEIKNVVAKNPNFKIAPAFEFSYLSSMILHAVTLLIGFGIIALCKTGTEEVFSIEMKKMSILFCVLAVLIPFFSQWIQSIKAIKRYVPKIHSFITNEKSKEMNNDLQQISQINKANQ